MLQAEGLCKAYRGKQVLDQVSFSIAPCELVGIMGASGEGKSTLARILCGTVSADDGKVDFLRQPLIRKGSYAGKRRREIQLIPQQPFAALDPGQSILDAVAEPIRVHQLAGSAKEARRQAENLLSQMLLGPELLNRKPGELSGGQAQRALIARSLTVQPKLLIADEATSMLDISSQAEIIRIFRKLAQERALGILLITHDQPLAEAVCHRIYCLSDGRMEEI